MSIQIQHDPAARRFTATVEGHEAELTYELQSGCMAITHTGVPAAIAGKGVAGALVRAALEHARAEGLKVVLVCSYAATYVQRHPQYADLKA